MSKKQSLHLRENYTIYIIQHDGGINSNQTSFRSSGKGGQHANKTDSAIRLTHLGSGIVVVCQDERSQHRNKEIALNRLRIKLEKLTRKFFLVGLKKN